jgi:hypothetical protein
MDDRTLLALAVLRGISVEGAPPPDVAAAILADADAPPRLTWQGILATRHPDRIREFRALSQPLAEALVRRSGVVAPEE